MIDLLSTITDDAPEPMPILLRCSSHRARQRLFNHLGRTTQGYYSFREGGIYGVYEVRPEELDEARKIRGITKVRNVSLYMKCWG